MTSWDLRAANSMAVGGGAGADAAAAKDEGVGGRAGGNRDEVGRSDMERSSWSRYFLALRYVRVVRLGC